MLNKAFVIKNRRAIKASVCGDNCAPGYVDRILAHTRPMSHDCDGWKLYPKCDWFWYFM